MKRIVFGLGIALLTFTSCKDEPVKTIEQKKEETLNLPSLDTNHFEKMVKFIKKQGSDYQNGNEPSGNSWTLSEVSGMSYTFSSKIGVDSLVHLNIIDTKHLEVPTINVDITKSKILVYTQDPKELCKIPYAISLFDKFGLKK